MGYGRVTKVSKSRNAGLLTVVGSHYSFKVLAIEQERI